LKTRSTAFGGGGGFGLPHKGVERGGVVGDIIEK
jgi:hypothetical protein